MPKQLAHLIILLFFVLTCFQAKAQKKDTVHIAFNQLLLLPDTIYYGINDSVVVVETEWDYRLIKNFLVRKPAYYERKPHKKESVTRLHGKYVRMLMGQIHTRQEDLPEDFNPADSYYTYFKDRIIKDIYIEAVPVLDGNLVDTSEADISTFGRFLNSTYHPTREKIVRNNLTFETNEKVNPRIFSDNERLLRNLSYIEDAKIRIEPVPGSTDSVNVIVLTKDKYPIGIGGDINDYNHFEIEPYTRNFMGRGHNVGLLFQFNGSADDKLGFGGYYAIDNMWGEFVNSQVSYNRGIDQNFFRIELEKPFYTSSTRLGGEVVYEKLEQKVWEKDDVIDSLYPNNEMYSVDVFDIWSGYSFLFDNDPTRPFLNIAGRFYVEKYDKRPGNFYELNYPFHDKYLYLASASLQKVSYIKTSKLLQFGKIEDVPVGINFNATLGWSHTTFYDRPYLGARLNYSVFAQNAGIFYTALETGGFWYDNKFEDAVTGFQFNYLSPLGRVGRFELRNIFEVSYTALYNPRYLIPVVYTNYELDMEEYGYLGDANIEFNYRPVFYSPYDVAGFRFSFNPVIDLGWLRSPKTFSGKREFYSMVGLTTSMKNESLIFPAMHVYVGYYVNELRNEPRFEFKVVFKDLSIFSEFTSLKPRLAHPGNFR